MRAVTKRFDFADLERYLQMNYHDPHKRRAAQTTGQQLSNGRIAELVGCGIKNIHWYRRDGLSEMQADRACCRLNIHPSAIWPDWWGPEASEAHDGELELA